MTSLEDIRDRFAEMMTAERASSWAAGDLVCDAIRLNANAKTRGAIIRDFASLGHCTAAHIRQLAERCATFPQESELRFPDIGPALYRAVIAAVKRLRRAKDLEHPMWTPAGLLQEAMKNGWHVKDLAVLGVPQRPSYELATRCGGCAAEVRVKAAFPLPSLPCPVCVRRAWEDGQSGREVDLLGALT